MAVAYNRPADDAIVKRGSSRRGQSLPTSSTYLSGTALHILLSNASRLHQPRAPEARDGPLASRAKEQEFVRYRHCLSASVAGDQVRAMGAMVSWYDSNIVVGHGVSVCAAVLSGNWSKTGDDFVGGRWRSEMPSVVFGRDKGEIGVSSRSPTR
ncbi:hypothetical protein B0I35DRAFT_408856 [Stachybotrys elegans]|uniref:Uncharacterized protein n=1 Tax=Stachybotrys elegans TaxID=80388 RepID=A0A8K0WRN5_9HYPO|nr:hypothetical protein B0I35DRAFT_408856 [Stachybotrys elegans]